MTTPSLSQEPWGRLAPSRQWEGQAAWPVAWASQGTRKLKLDSEEPVLQPRYHNKEWKHPVPYLHHSGHALQVLSHSRAVASMQGFTEALTAPVTQIKLKNRTKEMLRGRFSLYFLHDVQYLMYKWIEFTSVTVAAVPENIRTFLLKLWGMHNVQAYLLVRNRKPEKLSNMQCVMFKFLYQIHI